MRGIFCEANAAGAPPPLGAPRFPENIRERYETPGVPHLSSRFAGMPPPPGPRRCVGPPASPSALCEANPAGPPPRAHPFSGKYPREIRNAGRSASLDEICRNAASAGTPPPWDHRPARAHYARPMLRGRPPRRTPVSGKYPRSPRRYPAVAGKHPGNITRVAGKYPNPGSSEKSGGRYPGRRKIKRIIPAREIPHKPQTGKFPETKHLT